MFTAPLTVFRRCLHVSAIDFASPLRKKKVVNPITTRKQYERKVRRLEREITRLSSLEPTLIPIVELKLPASVRKELDQRQRPQVEEQDSIVTKYYLKLWSKYKSLESIQELRQIEMVARSQDKSLKLLRNEYPELWEKAVELDPELIPYTVSDVKKETPPNPAYQCPDGKKTDTTKLWKF